MSAPKKKAPAKKAPAKKAPAKKAAAPAKKAAAKKAAAPKKKVAKPENLTFSMPDIKVSYAESPAPEVKVTASFAAPDPTTIVDSVLDAITPAKKRSFFKKLFGRA